MSRDWRDVVPDGARDRTALCLAFLEEFPTEELARFVPLPAYERLLRLAGLTATDVARANLSSLAEMCALRAEIAHRDRALRHLAEVLSFVRGEYSIHELVDNAMRVTASGRPAERPLRITTTSDIAPLLKALDELACALRGVTKPKPEVPS